MRKFFSVVLLTCCMVSAAHAEASTHKPALQADSLMREMILLDRDIKTEYFKTLSIRVDLPEGHPQYAVLTRDIDRYTSLVSRTNAQVARWIQKRAVKPNQDGFVWIALVDPRNRATTWFTFKMRCPPDEEIVRLLPEDHAEVWYRLR